MINDNLAINMKFCFLIRFLTIVLLIGQIAAFFPFTKSPLREIELETVVFGIRGVPQYALSKYELDTLTCDDNKKTYTKNELNDGYCDCLDGSDEPGTSACNGNTFHCINKGYRITQIPSSRVDDGICDCCDGSDEGTATKCGNTCNAAAAKEKQMIEKVTAAYKIGSVIRASDIERIEKARVDSLATVEPLRAEVNAQKIAVERFRDTKNRVEREHLESSSSAEREATLTTEAILGLADMDEIQLTQFLSHLFSALDMNDDDVKMVLTEANITPFETIMSTPAAPFIPTSPSDEDHNDEEGYGDEEQGDANHVDAEAVPEVEQEIVEPEPVAVAEVIIATPFHCTLLDHVDDIRLQYLCTHKPQNDDESLLDDERVTASVVHINNAKQMILQLVKAHEVSSELQLLVGYQRMTGSYEGAVEFIKSHREKSDPHSCPAAWGNMDGVNDVCSISETLLNLIESIKNIPPLDAQPALDLAVSEQDLREMEKKLSESEEDLKEMDDYSEYLEYLALKDKCFDGLDGKFTYSVCILDKLTQRDGDDSSTEVTLGTFSSIETNKNTGGIIMHFTEGTNCWAFGPRTADVFITCGPEQKMLSSREPTTCYYTFEVESPSGCTERFAQINGII